ncbi:hypothetical protein FKP32DRAFT_1593547 [Trametes sanguinea]|nr:hypothetical protein FKP32DRAFT_1593547 [Trametes sanguinea]
MSPNAKLVAISHDEWMATFLPQMSDEGIVDFANQYSGLFDIIPGDEGECIKLQVHSLINIVNGASILGDFMLSFVCADYDKLYNGRKDLPGGVMYPKECPAAVTAQRTDWTAVEAFIVCTPDETCDPYDENTRTGVPSDPTRRDALDQVMCYASAAFDHQQLTHHYGVVLMGSWARLGRWDRAGVVFSSKFNYKQEPAKLVRFFRRVTHATPEARGHDPTAIRITPSSQDYDILLAWKAQEASLSEDDYVKQRFVKSLADDRSWWRITVADRKYGQRDFLVGHPTFATSDVVGRGTKGYIALCVSDPGTPLVFLKDCWRVDDGHSELEGDILSYLNEKGVVNVPTALYHGYVADQRTVSHKLCRCVRSGCVAEVAEADVDESAEQKAEREKAGEDLDDAEDDTDSEDDSEDREGVDLVSSDSESDDELSNTGDDSSGEANYQSVAGTDSDEAEVEDVDAYTDSESAREVECRMKVYRHYRLVVKEVGLPLREFPCGRILVWAIRDAVVAHEDAYEKAKTMHCDISVGNILILPPGGKNGNPIYQGLLVDWELSKRLSDYSTERRRSHRAGTWQFMSVRLQDYPDAEAEIADELESFLHVMIYCAINCLPHNCANTGEFLHQFFHDGVRRQNPGAGYTCGALKRIVIMFGALTTLSNELVIFFRHPQARVIKPKGSLVTSKKRPGLLPPPPHPINHVIAKLLPLLSARYRTIRVETADPLDAFIGSDTLARTRRSVHPHEQQSLEDAKSHRRMLEILNMASEEAAALWPGPEDRMPDQLKPSFIPNKPVETRGKRIAPVDKADGESSSKRPRGNTSQA